jgi:outer membrane biosynthesis protein TonB
MTKKAEHKILRVGLVKEGRVLEEKLLRKKEVITIGQSSRCTFTIPMKLQAYPLFKVEKNRYVLNFHSKMEGKLNIGKQTLQLATLISQNISSPHGKYHHLSLQEDMRGKIQVGDFTLLFQFIVPPPPVLKQRLPAIYRKTIWKSIDWTFATVLLGSFLVQSSLAAYMTNRDVDQTPRGLESISSRFIDIVDEKKEEPPPPPEEEKPKEEPKETKSDTPKEKDEPLPEPTTAANKKKRKEILTQRVASKTVLKFLAAGDGPGIMGQLSGEASRVSAEKAFEGAGLAMASSSTPNRRKASGSLTGTTMDIDENRLKGKRKRVKVGRKKEKKVKGRFKMTKPSDVIGTGTLSQSKINRTIKRYSRALQACYENELKKDSSLQGTIKVQFTIPPSGRASRVNVIKNTIGSRAVAKCISTQIKRWRFAKPKGGEVTVAYPFVFTPAN